MGEGLRLVNVLKERVVTSLLAKVTETRKIMVQEGEIFLTIATLILILDSDEQLKTQLIAYLKPDGNAHGHH